MRNGGTVGIVDYGMGNLRSVSKAIEHLGGTVYVGSDQKKLSRAAKLILPGVGAFGQAIQELKKRRLMDVILEFAERKKPLFGICLGLQLFFDSSAENPGVKGLGIWKGTVCGFNARKHPTLKIPHMGWNQVSFKRRSLPIVAKLKDNGYFYFVHSYYAKPKDSRLICGETNYGIKFPALLGAENIFAVQFHPEKSQRLGLQILKNFIRL
ncbi:MAG: imidazole glycerol phosphate synthase, glutamine amidotransferase subunit [Omnitrophica bacterium RIFCSPHIGHO2_02_FULL_46_11]|nr:MAG: imidazole glycerol phosphate synthase, glutamine amidotransferase subunit [Omnitrophica bacterium RIFCSPHIGHO2_02_FULL_46_11]OGW86316.1 MAG: imidazole glycerol phosphate synthase, glutamine amidotransferase subunit [Omnitrophica bacterium RIFCSPLOWO2_01_FULL_45_10b]